MLRELKKQPLGITDEVTECFCCGKKSLKLTVVFEIKEESELTGLNGFIYLGRDCAKRVGLIGNGKSPMPKTKIRKADYIDTFLSGTIDLPEIGKINVKLQWDCKARGLYYIPPSGDRKYLLRTIMLSELTEVWTKIKWMGDVQLLRQQVLEYAIEWKREDLLELFQ